MIINATSLSFTNALGRMQIVKKCFNDNEFQCKAQIYAIKAPAFPEF